MEADILSNVWPEWKTEGKPLGRGSYGTVYKAVRRDHNVESYAAIKVISIPSDQSEVDSLRSEGLDINATRTYLQGVVNDFVSEIQLMESFKGVQNIVSVEDYKVAEKKDELGWDIYIRMELLTPLNSYICDKTLSEAEVIKLGVDICTALELCAKRNVIHRDIKPENIFINQFGDFKLGDFGIARKLENVTGGLSQKGTYNYMAPEVEKGNQYDATVDLYSLGLVLYRFTNKNRLPFLDTERQLLNPNERMAAIRRRMDGEPLPPPCESSPALANVILCACSPEPRQRFSSAAAMKNALMHISGQKTVIAPTALDSTVSVRKAPQEQDSNRPASVRRPPQKQVPAQTPGQKSVNTFAKKKKTNALPIIAAILVAVLLIGGGIVFLPKLLKNKKPPADKETGSSTLGMAEEDVRIDSPVETVDSDGYSNFDHEQITSVLKEAEALAATEDYEGALTKIKAALVIYPKSEALQAKETEYTNAFATQVKGNTLKEAEAFAEAGDYASAIAIIHGAIEEYGNDPDYTLVYSNYCTAYKSEIILNAKAIADAGDYLGARQIIVEALTIIDNDEELLEKKGEYEDAFAADVVSQAESCLSQSNYDAAENIVNEALKQLPENAELISEKTRVDNAKPVYLLNVVTPYDKPSWYEANGVFDMAGQSYTHGFTCMGYGDAPFGNEVFFNLNGAYAALSFTSGIINNNRSNRDVNISIYADGSLIYGFAMKSNQLPTEHVVDITGCRQLKIAIYDGYWVADGSGTYGLANIMVTRNLNTDAAPSGSAGLKENQQWMLNAVTPYETPFWYTANEYFSMGGQDYSRGFTCMGYGDAPHGNEIFYNLNGDYTSLSFTFGIVSNNRSGNDVTVSIFVDGENIYSFKMERNELPGTHTVNISGCKQLVISVYDGYWVADGSGTYGFADMIITQND